MHTNILSTLPLRRKYANIPGMDQTLTDRLLTRRQVSERVGLGRSAIYARMAGGGFPRPIDLGPKCVRWSEREIEQWIAARPRSHGGRAVSTRARQDAA